MNILINILLTKMFPNSSKTGIYLFIKVKEVLYERDKQSLQGVVDHNGENSFHYHVDFSFRSLTSLWALMSVRCWLFVWLVSRSFCHNFLSYTSTLLSEHMFSVNLTNAGMTEYLTPICHVPISRFEPTGLRPSYGHKQHYMWVLRTLSEIEQSQKWI